MISRHVVGPLLLVVTIYAQLLAAPTSAVFQITPSPSATFSIARADENACNAAAGVATEETIKTLRQFALMVTNNSSASVTALTVVWTLVDTTGRARTQTFLSDSYMTPTLTRVIPPNARAILWPIVMYLQHDDGSWTNHQLFPNASLAAKFSNAASVTVTVDFVATSDGQFTGEDTKKTLESIHARKQAATDIASAIRRAQLSGESVDDVICQIRTTHALARSQLDKWNQRFAGVLVNASSREGFIRYLESLPEIASFKQARL